MVPLTPRTEAIILLGEILPPTPAGRQGRGLHQGHEAALVQVGQVPEEVAHAGPGVPPVRVVGRPPQVLVEALVAVVVREEVAEVVREGVVLPGGPPLPLLALVVLREGPEVPAGRVRPPAGRDGPGHEAVLLCLGVVR